MAQTEDDLPVLNDVIRTGNAAIIRSARLQRVVDKDKLVNSHAANLAYCSNDEALESLIDDIIDKHLVSLRQDLRNLLERATNPACDETGLPPT